MLFGQPTSKREICDHKTPYPHPALRAAPDLLTPQGLSSKEGLVTRIGFLFFPTKRAESKLQLEFVLVCSQAVLPLLATTLATGLE